MAKRRPNGDGMIRKRADESTAPTSTAKACLTAPYVPKAIIEDSGARGMQARAIPRSAAHVRHSRYPIRYGCEDAGGDHRSCFCGNDVEYLLPRDG